jgi:hypothetical protein
VIARDLLAQAGPGKVREPAMQEAATTQGGR